MTKLAIPTNSDELAELIGNPEKAAQLVESGQLTDAVKAYARTVVQKDTDVAAQIREQTQMVMADLLGEQKVTADVRRLNQAALQNQGGQFTQGVRGRGRPSVYNAKAPGAALDKIFGNSAEFFRMAWHQRDTLPDAGDLHLKAREVKKVQNSFGTQIPDAGGFLVPEVLRAEILRLALESSVVRQRARVIPMDSARVALPMVDSTTNAGSVFGGIVCYWTAESAPFTETQARFGRLVLEASKLTGLAYVPNELIADAPAFGAFFDQVFPEAMAWYEDDAFFTGDGVGRPLGFVGNAASVTVAKESGQNPDTIVWENLVRMYARMLPTSHSNAVWIVSPDTWAELATMALSVGTGGSAIFVQNGTADMPMTILGRPVITSEKAPKLGDQGDVSYVDLGYYVIGDRQAMTAASSAAPRFEQDETVFKIVERLDGRPWLQSPITPRNGGATLSPFVQLAERA